MICPNCGTQNAVGEKICMGCKKELPRIEAKAIRENEKPDKEAGDEKEAKKKKPKNRLKNKNIIKGAIGVIILIIVVVAAVIVYRYKTKNLNANDPVYRLETVVNTFSTDMSEYFKYILPEQLSKDGITIAGSIEDSDKKPDLLAEYSKLLDHAYNAWKDEFGDDLVISFDILYKEKLSDEEVDKVEEFYASAFTKYITDENKSYDAWTSALAEKYDISEGKAKKFATALNDIQQYCSTIQVSAGYDLVVRINFSGRKSSGNTLIDVYVVKTGGTWSIDLNSTVKKYLANPVLTDAMKIK